MPDWNRRTWSRRSTLTRAEFSPKSRANLVRTRKLRYPDIFLCVRTLFGINSRLVQELFLCGQIRASRVENVDQGSVHSPASATVPCSSNQNSIVGINGHRNSLTADRAIYMTDVPTFKTIIYSRWTILSRPVAGGDFIFEKSSNWVLFIKSTEVIFFRKNDDGEKSRNKRRKLKLFMQLDLNFSVLGLPWVRIAISGFAILTMFIVFQVIY